MTMPTAKTFTATKGARAPNANDPIVALRDLDGEYLEDVPEKVTSSLGRDGSCDVVLDRPQVSAVHCFFERRPSGLRVTNNSKNGTWFEGDAQPTFELRPGEVFEVDGVKLLAMTAPMKAAQVDLRRLLGSTDPGRVGRVLALGATAAASAIAGEPGSGHADLAAILHGCSLRRTRCLETVTSLEDLRHLLSKDHDVLRLGAVFVDLARCPRIKAQAPDLARGLGDVIRGGMIGVYVGCDDPARLQAELGFALGPERLVEIPPLRTRPHDIPGLLEHLLGADALEKLSEPNRRALLKHRWRENFEGLRDDCAKLRMVIENDGNCRRAARASNVEHSGLSRLVKKLGLRFADDAE